MDDERTYTNPVYDGYLGDPFVLKYNGEYYAYGTVPFENCSIPVLHSRDLVNWTHLGDALRSTDKGIKCLWAPEVAYDNGVFYMYYSAGGEEGEGHQLRIATAGHPAGPFEPGGEILTPDDPFTIDAHPFRDEDGQWYLYYSRDFLEGERVGTGIVVDRLVDMTRLAGERTVVVRPHAEWQVYERQRHWYGRVWDWYTVEGAFIRKRDGRYYCFYSGGAWRESNYGISYLSAESPMGPFDPGVDVGGPRVLRTVPGQVVGPGHACVATAPDNLHQYLVYHAWDAQHSGRLMRLDALRWTSEGPVSGATLAPQSEPQMPLYGDLFDGTHGPPLDPGAWRTDGDGWRVEHGEALGRDGAAILEAVPERNAYLYEANIRHADSGRSGGSYGVYAGYSDHDNYTQLALEPAGPELCWRVVSDGREAEKRTLDLSRLGQRFRPDAYHQVLVSKQGNRATLHLDGVLLGHDLPMPAAESRMGLFAQGTSAAFDGVAVSELG